MLRAMTDHETTQRVLCSRVGADYVATATTERLGLGRDVRQGVYPVNGLRHPPEGGTCGWYIWVGEGDPPGDSDFFVPLHVGHLRDRLPEVEPYLGLAPGWRFLVAPDYEDVWFDASLLDV